MNFKLRSFVLATLITCGICTPSIAEDFVDFYTTGSFGSTTPKFVFLESETPFLYINLPNNKLTFTNTFWVAPDSSSEFAGDGPGTDVQRWLAIANWNDVKQTGEWTVNGSFLSSDGNFGAATTSFNVTVTPEPLSTLLFITGAAPLTMALLRKKKSA